jgi:DNA-binding NarL/FixJ family response regulator
VQRARELLPQCQPDIILLDLGLPDTDGQQFIPELRQLAPEARIIVLSQREEGVFAPRAIRAGAHGYLMKTEAAAQLRRAIDAVMAGAFYLSHSVAALMPELGGTQARAQGLANLSDRELQVFTLIGQGLGPKEIANRLLISPKTVEAHRENLKRKLNLESSALLTQRATRWVQYGKLDGPTAAQA